MAWHELVSAAALAAQASGPMIDRTLTVQDIAVALDAEVIGDASIIVRSLSEPARAGPDDLAIALNDHYVVGLAEGQALAAVMAACESLDAVRLKAAIIARPGRQVLATLSRLFERPYDDGVSGIDASAIIAPSAEIGTDCTIGPMAVIGARARIGPASSIGAHVTIGPDVTIGAGARLMSGVRIGWGTRIGERFIAQSNAVIGSEGFSYTADPKRSLAEDGGDPPAAERIASLGIVVIGDDVEIGAGSTIDRATIHETVIGSGSKLDNQVHVAHNVQIGRNCIICGHVGIAGSARLGDHVMLGGMSGVGDHVSVAAHAFASGATKIFSNQNRKGVRLIGSPATDFETGLAIYKSQRRLPKTVQRMTDTLDRMDEVLRRPQS